MKFIGAAVVICCLVSFGESSSSSKPKPYHGHQVFEIIPKTLKQLNFLAKLGDIPSYDFWKEPRAIGEPVHVRVDDATARHLKLTLAKMHMPYSVPVNDVQALIDRVELQSAFHLATRRASSSIVGTFPATNDTNEWMETMCKTYPDLAKCGVAGSTYENRTIYYFTIGSNQGSANKSKVVLEGTMHAREWLGTATVIWIADKLLTTYSTDPQVKTLVDTYDFIVIPIVNVDGYEYTRSKERLWRKTRSQSKTQPTCFGTDPNRNWDHEWGTVGTSNSPCADTYHGTGPFSEIETKTLSQFIEANKQNMLAYFAVHAYSQYWLIPYGAGPNPSDFDELLRVANIGAKALMEVNNKRWKVGNIQDVIYPAAGGSIDWVKDTVGVKYCYAFEVRPASTALNGFVVSASEIEPSGKEVYAGLVAALDAMKK